MAKGLSRVIETRVHESYEDLGSEKSIEITLSATPGTVTTVNIEEDFKGFKIYPLANDIRFAVSDGVVSRTVSSKTTSSSTTINTTDLVSGGVAKADLWEVRSFLSGESRTLMLLSATASVVVELELF